MRHVLMGLVTMKLGIMGSVILRIVIRRIMMVGTVMKEVRLWMAVHQMCLSVFAFRALWPEVWPGSESSPQEGILHDQFLAKAEQ